MTADIELLWQVARFKAADYLREDGLPDVAKILAAPQGTFARIDIRWRVDDTGAVEAQVKFWAPDVPKALRALAKHAKAGN